MMPVTVKYLMLSMILLSKLTDCDIIAPIATLYRYQLEVNTSSVIFHANYLCGCTCVCEGVGACVCVCVFVCVCVYPGDDYVAFSATPNPFLLNKICLNHLSIRFKLFIYMAKSFIIKLLSLVLQ